MRAGTARYPRSQSAGQATIAAPLPSRVVAHLKLSDTSSAARCNAAGPRLWTPEGMVQRPQRPQHVVRGDSTPAPHPGAHDGPSVAPRGSLLLQKPNLPAEIDAGGL